MTLKTQMATDVANVFLNTDEFAEAITYTPANGSGASVNAVVMRDSVSHDNFQDGLSSVYRATIKLASADVSAPAINDTVTFDGRTWTVVEVDAGDPGGMHEIRVQQIDRTEVSRQNHRLQR